MQSSSFKICGKCGAEWSERDTFLTDPDLSLVGYQIHFEELKTGLFLFTHNCKTTLAIEAGEFQDLYHGPIFIERLANTEECLGHCLHSQNLNPCSRKMRMCLRTKHHANNPYLAEK
jgi:hypothetical protein